MELKILCREQLIQTQDNSYGGTHRRIKAIDYTATNDISG